MGSLIHNRAESLHSVYGTPVAISLGMTHHDTHPDPADSAIATLVRGLVATGVVLALVNVAIVCLAG